MVLGIPVGAFCPFTNWFESIYLSNHVTRVHRSVESLIGDIESAMNDRSGFVAETNRMFGPELRRHISGLDGGSATSAIMEEIDALTPAVEAQSHFKPGGGIRRLYNRTEYEKKKIDLSLKELAASLQVMLRITGTRIDVNVEKLGDSMFAISRYS
jgi:hypothetical protein